MFASAGRESGRRRAADGDFCGRNSGKRWRDVAGCVNCRHEASRRGACRLHRGAANGGGTSLSPQISLSVSAPPNTIWRVESADALSGPWQLVDIVTNTPAGIPPLVDTGQNGRLPPSQVSQRFYRIVPN